MVALNRIYARAGDKAGGDVFWTLRGDALTLSGQGSNANRTAGPAAA